MSWPRPQQRMEQSASHFLRSAVPLCFVPWCPRHSLIYVVSATVLSIKSSLRSRCVINSEREKRIQRNRAKTRKCTTALCCPNRQRRGRVAQFLSIIVTISYLKYKTKSNERIPILINTILTSYRNELYDR